MKRTPSLRRVVLRREWEIPFPDLFMILEIRVGMKEGKSEEGVTIRPKLGSHDVGSNEIVSKSSDFFHSVLKYFFTACAQC